MAYKQNMNSLLRFCALAVLVWLVALPSQAQRHSGEKIDPVSHRSNQHRQNCSPEVLASLAQFLNLKAVEFSQNDADQEDTSLIVDAACTKHPEKKNVEIVAIAYHANLEFKKAFLVALVDTSIGNVLSSYQASIAEFVNTEDDQDISMIIGAGSLYIDSELFRLNETKKAFSIDVRKAASVSAGCVSGEQGPVRYMFVQEGKQLKQVLAGLPISFFTYIQGPANACAAADAPTRVIIENSKVSISVLKKKTNAYFDLLLRLTSSRDDGQQTARKPLRMVLRYDGVSYPVEAWKNQVLGWRSPKAPTTSSDSQ